MIHILDYGLGNVHAFITAYKKLGFDAVRAKSKNDLKGAEKLILPGVGSFDQAMQLLDKTGMKPQLEKLVLQDRIPILGVCVGMQVLASSSEEGKLSGFGWIPGKVRLMKTEKTSSKFSFPHMGWNEIKVEKKHPLLKNLDFGARFYFLHSYYFDCDEVSHIAATSLYNFNFCCAVVSDNIFGVQFHPEKSHQFGIQLLKNFAKI